MGEKIPTGAKLHRKNQEIFRLKREVKFNYKWVFHVYHNLTFVKNNIFFIIIQNKFFINDFQGIKLLINMMPRYIIILPKNTFENPPKPII
jgi:hypothetical protein